MLFGVSPGWGYVNHRSNVWFEDNASYDVFGAHFTDEDGTELGGFRRNIAIYCPARDYVKSLRGDFPAIEKEREAHDHGHSGIGFWATSGATVRWEGNISSDHTNAGYAVISRKTPDDAQLYNTNKFDDPSIAGGVKVLKPKVQGMNFFRNNKSIGGNHGLAVIDMELNGLINSNNMFENFTVINAKGNKALDLEYSRNIYFKNAKIIVDDARIGRKSWGIKCFGTWDHLFYEHVKSWTYIEGLKLYGYDGAFANWRDNNDRYNQDSKFLVIGDENELNLPSGGRVIHLQGNQYLRYVDSMDDIPSRPVFSKTPGSYAEGSIDITISTDPNTTVYYKVDTQGNEGNFHNFPNPWAVTK